MRDVKCGYNKRQLRAPSGTARVSPRRVGVPPPRYRRSRRRKRIRRGIPLADFRRRPKRRTSGGVRARKRRLRAYRRSATRPFVAASRARTRAEASLSMRTSVLHADSPSTKRSSSARAPGPDVSRAVDARRSTGAAAADALLFSSPTRLYDPPGAGVGSACIFKISPR
jgi:hypothetical protein